VRARDCGGFRFHVHRSHNHQHQSCDTSANRARPHTRYAHAEQSTLPVDPNPDPSRPLAADPTRPLHYLPDGAPDLLFAMPGSVAVRMLRALSGWLRRGTPFSDSLCAGVLMGLVAVVGRPYVVTDRAFEVHKDEVSVRLCVCVCVCVCA
jgi:hypothetical protein